MLTEKQQKWKQQWLDDAMRAFKWSGFYNVTFEEFDNQYCGPFCCPHLPWLRVKTDLGTFTLGWRKRVMHLEWQDTQVKKDGVELFASEDTTKGARMIHCWGYAKLIDYLRALKKEEKKNGNDQT